MYMLKIIIATEGVELLSCRSVAGFHLLGFTVGHQNCKSYERNSMSNVIFGFIAYLK